MLDVHARLTRTKAFLKFFGDAAGFGAMLGAIVGCAEVVVMFTLANGLLSGILGGPIYGGIPGALIGGVTGIVGGVIGGVVTITGFWPVTDRGRYVRTMRAVAATSALIFGVGILNLFLPHHLIVGTEIFLVVIPAMSSLIGGWYAGGCVALRHLSRDSH